MHPSTRPRREATEARWQAALARAVSNGLEAFVAADTGERFVTSASKLDTLHRCDGHQCSCDAALAGDPVCMHRAVVRSVMGWLPEFEDAPVPTIACPECSGGGVVYVKECARSGWPHPTCPVCAGSGESSIPILTTHVDLTAPAA